MKFKRNFLQTFLRAFSVAMLILVQLSASFAQEILDEQSIPIPQNANAEFVPNEIIVNFLPKTIALPQGRIEADLNEIIAHPQIASLLRTSRVSKLSKIFRFFTPADTIRILETGERVQVQDLSQVFLLTFPGSVDVKGLVNLYKNSPRVIYTQPNYIYRLTAEREPSDPGFWQQWGLEQTNDEDIDAVSAWELQLGNYSIKIGIFDSGIDYNHDDLGSAFGVGWKVVGGWDWVNNDSNPMDDHYHGTHVAGIASALTNNTKDGQYVGIAGVSGGWGYNRNTNTGNKGAQLFAMKTFDNYGSGNTAITANAIIEGADPDGDGWGYGLHILNNSWGQYQYDETLRSAINYAARMNRVFVAAKGNDNTSSYHYPSDFDASWIISVGATNQSGSRAQSPDWGWSAGKGSNLGNGIDVAAPGTYIYATTPTYTTPEMTNWGIPTNYGHISGTSMATPHVSGLAALILSKNSSLHPEDVQGIIRASADDVNFLTYPGYDQFLGAGRINAGRALQYMNSPWILNQYTASGGTSVSNTGTYSAVFYNTGGGLSTGTYIVKRYDVRKTVTFPANYQGTPFVWGRGVNTTVGWSAANPNYQTGYCNIVSSTSTSAELQTFVYEVWTILGSYLGWKPAPPSNVSFAYSILGIPSGAMQTKYNGSSTVVSEKPEQPESFALDQNYPNPFNPSTIIKYQLPEVGHVKLSVYDLLGKETATLVNEVKRSGVYEVEFNAGGLPSGVYVYRMQSGSCHESKKMILTK